MARALEKDGIRTALTSWHSGVIRTVLPPRATLTKLERGMTMGHPHDHGQQKRILMETLKLLALDTPLEPVVLDEA